MGNNTIEYLPKSWRSDTLAVKDFLIFLIANKCYLPFNTSTSLSNETVVDCVTNGFECVFSYLIPKKSGYTVYPNGTCTKYSNSVIDRAVEMHYLEIMSKWHTASFRTIFQLKNRYEAQ